MLSKQKGENITFFGFVIRQVSKFRREVRTERKNKNLWTNKKKRHNHISFELQRKTTKKTNFQGN